MLEVAYEIHDIGCNIIVKDDNFNFIVREILADYISMDPEEYTDIMIKKFNGKLIKLNTYKIIIVFSNKKDVLKAIDWYKSMLIMDKLINPNN